jgi:hypothetical protein
MSRRFRYETAASPLEATEYGRVGDEGFNCGALTTASNGSHDQLGSPHHRPYSLRA